MEKPAKGANTQGPRNTACELLTDQKGLLDHLVKRLRGDGYKEAKDHSPLKDLEYRIDKTGFDTWHVTWNEPTVSEKGFKITHRKDLWGKKWPGKRKK